MTLEQLQKISPEDVPIEVRQLVADYRKLCKILKAENNGRAEGMFDTLTTEQRETMLFCHQLELKLLMIDRNEPGEKKKSKFFG